MKKVMYFDITDVENFKEKININKDVMFLMLYSKDHIEMYPKIDWYKVEIKITKVKKRRKK